MILHKRLRFAIAVAAAGAAALVPSSANAGLLAAKATSCDAQTFSQPFLQFADPASYTLAPGGDFESGAWSGGSTASGNEPWYVTSSSDSQSLSLSSGSSATSPTICVGIQHPDIRFFARASSALATLKVEVLYLDGNGNTQSLTIGGLTGNNGWALSQQMPIIANLLPLLPGAETPVAFRVTATSGSWNVDDFYVDPYTRW